MHWMKTEKIDQQKRRGIQNEKKKLVDQFYKITKFR